MVSPLAVVPVITVTMIVTAYLGYTGRLNHPSMYIFMTAATLAVLALSILLDTGSPLLLYVAGIMTGISLVLALIVIGLLFVALRRSRYVNRAIGQTESLDYDNET